MSKILAFIAFVVFSAADAFAGTPAPMPVTIVPTLSEWGAIGAIVLLGVVGTFFLVNRGKRGCCS